MILKYDVYVKIEKNITIIQLIPDRREWTIKIPKDEEKNVKEYIHTLEIGQLNSEYNLKIEKESLFIKKLDKFFREKGLISEYESDTNSNLYSHRQLEVFDSWNRTAENPSEFQKRIENSNTLVIGAGYNGLIN